MCTGVFTEISHSKKSVTDTICNTEGRTFTKMSAERVTVRVDDGSGPPAAFPVALKKILEIPPPNLLECTDGT